MATSFFYTQNLPDSKSHQLLKKLEAYSQKVKVLTYVVSRPMSDSRYTYDFSGGLVVLIPKCKITFVNLSGDEDSFEDYMEEFIEDLGSLSDKYKYKDYIGRPKKWRELCHKINVDDIDSIDDFIDEIGIVDAEKQRVCELLISLLVGSINDISKVGSEVPETLLDKVKKKILLFDADQSRFIYSKPMKDVIKIQGLSGTGKTELLLHKLKDLYTQGDANKIAFTCHNKVLSRNLKSRIPEFFNFMKVEQQIEWEKRLWCVKESLQNS